jgi:hypothetical protein
MPLHPNVRRCTHIHITGHRCGSPALKQEYFCYFHTRMIKGVQTRVDSQIHPIALIENPEAIQSAIMHMIDGVLKGTIDNKRAALVLKALYIAVRNSRNVHFRIRPDDMVRQVPNYAEQYLSEHPELSQCGAGAPAREAASPYSADTPVREAAAKAGTDGQAQAAPQPALPNSSPEKATPERPTEPAAERRQNAAHGASRGNKVENHQAPEDRKRTPDPPNTQPVSLPSHPANPPGKIPTPLPGAKTSPHSRLVNRNAGTKSKNWKPPSRARCTATGATCAPSSTP